MNVVLAIETENQSLLINFLKSLTFVTSVQVLDFTLQDTEISELAELAEESFATVWEGMHNEHWDDFLFLKDKHL